MAKQDDNQPDMAVAEVPKALTKLELRDKIFATENSIPQSETFDFCGVTLEVRQPSVGRFLEEQQSEDQKQFIAMALIRYAYIPGTEDKIFDPADYESLVAMPFNQSWTRAIGAIQKLMDIKVEEKAKN